MRTPPSGPDEAALRAALARGLDRPADPETQRQAGFLADAFGPGTTALVHYGSHVHGVGAGPGSAWDFFVIVDDYRAAYRALAASVPRVPAPGRAAALNRLLPPNVLAVRGPEAGLPRTAKCCVLSLADLERACAEHARDHFVRARLFQDVRLVWARDETSRARLVAMVAAARRATFAWGRPFLPARFDAATYARRLLEVSYAAEIRPEDDRHLDALLEAQSDTLVPTFDALLAHLAAAGALERSGDLYRDRRPPRSPARACARAWFALSKARATLRWIKYVALYDDWLDYVVRKVERRSGTSLALSARERRWPLLFLWPRALRYLFGRRSGPQG